MLLIKRVNRQFVICSIERTNIEWKYRMSGYGIERLDRTFSCGQIGFLFRRGCLASWWFFPGVFPFTSFYGSCDYAATIFNGPEQGFHFSPVINWLYLCDGWSSLSVQVDFLFVEGNSFLIFCRCADFNCFAKVISYFFM